MAKFRRKVSWNWHCAPFRSQFTVTVLGLHRHTRNEVSCSCAAHRPLPHHNKTRNTNSPPNAMAAYERLAVDDGIQPPAQHPPQGIGPNGPATLFQRFSFTWVNTLLRHGRSQPLALQDYPPLPESLKVQTGYGELDRAWRAEVVAAGAGTPNLWVVLWRLYKKPFALMGVARVRHVLRHASVLPRTHKPCSCSKFCPRLQEHTFSNISSPISNRKVQIQLWAPCGLLLWS